MKETSFSIVPLKIYVWHFMLAHKEIDREIDIGGLCERM